MVYCSCDDDNYNVQFRTRTMYIVPYVGTNNFVRVNYNSETNSFNCTFINLPSNDLKQCTANITYGTNCDQQLSGAYTDTSTGDYVTIPQLELINGVTGYCFTVVASSGDLTAAIRGRIFVVIGIIILSSSVTIFTLR